jgi:uncharacterized MAPEG superfamily protein
MTYADILILIAFLIPYASIAYAKALAKDTFSNADPRNPQAYTGTAKLAQGAHINGLESFPFFAIAVLFAEFRSAPQLYISVLAAVYVFMRILYTAAYIQDKPTQRSILFSLSFLVSVGIFLLPLLGH